MEYLCYVSMVIKNALKNRIWRLQLDVRFWRLNPLDPNLLGITASPTDPPGAADPIGDIIIDHILSFKDST